MKHICFMHYSMFFDIKRQNTNLFCSVMLSKWHGTAGRWTPSTRFLAIPSITTSVHIERLDHVIRRTQIQSLLHDLILAQCGKYDRDGVAVDGIDAMNKIRDTRPDVAIIDGIMPRLDGDKSHSPDKLCVEMQ